MDYGNISALALAIACCNTQNSAAWREFYRRYHHSIRAAAAAVADRYRSHSRSELDDIVSSTYLRMLVNECRYLRRFTPGSDAEAQRLLWDITTKTARNYYRDSQRKKRFPEARFMPLNVDVLEAPSTDTADALEQRLIVESLLRQLSGLLASSRTAALDEIIFRRRFQEGLTLDEIAASPDIALKPRGVEASLRRSLRKLRDHLAIR